MHDASQRFVYLDWSACRRSARLILDRPKANALDLTMVLQIEAAIEETDREERLKLLVIESAQKDFCLGGDLHYLSERRNALPSALQELLEPWHRALVKLRTLKALTLAVVDGGVCGGGIGLMASCDLSLVSVRSYFLSGFSSLGLTCDSGLSTLLPQLMGRSRAAHFLIDDRPLSAIEAQQWGLVSEVVETDQLAPEVQRRKHCVELLPGVAVRGLKSLLATHSRDEMEREMALEIDTIREAAAAPQVAPRIDAFIQLATRIR